MISLNPDKTYIYEHVDGITYAREFGAPPDKRFEIHRTSERQDIIDNLREDKLWGDIRRAAKSNPLLQDAIDRVKIIYELTNQDGKEQTR